MADHSEAGYRRRESDSVIGQLKSLWPVLVFCCIGYAAWEVQRSRLTDTTTLAVDTAKDVNILKQTVAVQTAMLQEIKETVKEIAKSQRRRAVD